MGLGEQEKSRGSSPLLPFNLGWKILTWFEGHGNSMAKENDQDKIVEDC
jgi:hypothetical protein